MYRSHLLLEPFPFTSPTICARALFLPSQCPTLVHPPSPYELMSAKSVVWKRLIISKLRYVCWQRLCLTGVIAMLVQGQYRSMFLFISSYYSESQTLSMYKPIYIYIYVLATSVVVVIVSFAKESQAPTCVGSQRRDRRQPIALRMPTYFYFEVHAASR